MLQVYFCFNTDIENDYKAASSYVRSSTIYYIIECIAKACLDYSFNAIEGECNKMQKGLSFTDH